MNNENQSLETPAGLVRRYTTTGMALGALGLGLIYADVDLSFSSMLDAVNQQSDGSGMDTSFTFELGTFDAGFTPDASNTNLWSSNWTAVPGDSDAQYTQAPSPVFTKTGASNNFSGSVTLTSNNSPFGTSDQAFIWGFDDRGDSGTGEWVLITNPDWLFPGVTEGAIQTPHTPYQVQNDGTIALLGSVNPGHSAPSDAPHIISESVTLRPVPEPSTGLLALMALGMTVARRRR